jgi:hypothetical protein
MDQARQITKYVSQDDEFDEEETIYTVYNTDSGKTVKTYKVNLGLGSTSVEFQLDTGSACTIINEKLYRDKLSQCTLQNTNTTDPSKCINDQTLRSDTEFCQTSLLKLSDKCPTKLSDKILPGRSESLHSQIVKL